MANLNNGAYSTLASGITAGATTLTLATGEGSRFPSADFYLCVYDSRYPNWSVAFQNGAGEVMLVGTRSSDTCSSITRGVGGSTAIAFNTTGVTYRAELNYVAENFADTSNSLNAVWYVDATYASSNTAARKVKTITEALGSNRTIYVAAGTYSEELNISNYNNLKIVGLGKPRWTGATLSGGTILTYASTSKNIVIQNNSRGIVLENLGVINTSTGDGFGVSGYAGVTIQDVTIRDCIAVMPSLSGHGFLFEEFGGTVDGITVSNCKSYNGNHGIIAKAKNVLIDNCYVENARIYSFGAISDNVNGATQISGAKNVEFRKCKAYRSSSVSGAFGFTIYCIDFHSTSLANGVVAAEGITFIDCWAEGMDQGFSFARDNGAYTFPQFSASASELAPINVKLIGCTAKSCDNEGFIAYYSTDLVLVGCTARSNGGVGYQEDQSTTPRAIGCYALGNSDDTFTGWSTGNI